MERPEKFYGKPSEGFEKTKRLAAQLLELCQTAAPALPEDLKDACRELEQRYEESTFRVVVLRMFSRGKSTFLNALIGRRLLYESDREATGAITLLRNSPPLYRGGPFTGRDGLSEEQAQVIRQAMARLGLEDPRRGLMVGDRKYDVEGARECGMDCAGVEFFGYAPPGELESAGAVAVVRTVAELEAFILQRGR